MIRITRILPLLLICTGCLAASCATSSDKPTQEVAEQQNATPEASDPMPDAKPFVAQAASWFPADTYAVGAMTAEQYWDFAARFMPEGRRGSETDEPGTLGGLRSDLSRMMLDRVGVDVTGLDGAVFGVGHDSGGLVLFGDIELDEQRYEVRELDGHEVLAFEMQGIEAGEDGEGVWMVRFDEPQKGVAVFYKEAFLKQALATRFESDDESNLTSAKANLDLPLFEELPSGSFIAVARIDDRLLEEIGNTPFPPPDRIGLSFGGELTVVMEGAEASLDGVSQYAKRFRAMATSYVERARRRADSSDTPEAVGALIAYHYMYAYLETYDETRKDGRLTYNIAMPDTGATFMGPGILAAIAIPSFMKYLKRSKASEAEFITEKMGDGAKAYFTSEQKGCGKPDECQSPWHANARAGIPVKFKDYVFPGGTNAHVVSLPTPPTGGAKSSPAPQLGPDHKAQSKDVDAILNALGVSFSDPMYFQYVYTTGPGTGVDATATIQAFADFEGDGEPNHELRLDVRIDPSSKAVNVFPKILMNEFQ